MHNCTLFWGVGSASSLNCFTESMKGLGVGWWWHNNNWEWFVVSFFLFAYFYIVLPYIINLIMLLLLSITKCVITLQLDHLWTDKNLEWHFAIQVTRTAGILKSIQNPITKSSLPDWPVLHILLESSRSTQITLWILLTILQHPPQNYSHTSQGIWINCFLPTVHASAPSNMKSEVYFPRFNGHYWFCRHNKMNKER